MSDPNVSLAEAAAQVDATAETIVNPTIESFYALYPALREKHGPKGIERCREDCFYHIEFLVAALRANSPKQFVEYIRWVRVLLGARDAADNLINMLEMLGQRIRETQGGAVWAHVQPILDAGLQALQHDSATRELAVMPRAVVGSEAKTIASRD